MSSTITYTTPPAVQVTFPATVPGAKGDTGATGPAGPAGPAGVGSISDGDRGDITVSGSGTVWTIDNGVVTPVKLGTGTIDNSSIIIDGGLL